MTAASHPASLRRSAARQRRPGLPPAGWLSFAALPTFALMALSTGFEGSPSDICSSGQGVWVNGMAAMYLLMSAFHAGPWLALMGSRKGRQS